MVSVTSGAPLSQLDTPRTWSAYQPVKRAEPGRVIIFNLPLWVMFRDILGYDSRSIGILEKNMEISRMGYEL